MPVRLDDAATAVDPDRHAACGRQAVVHMVILALALGKLRDIRGKGRAVSGVYGLGHLRQGEGSVLVAGNAILFVEPVEEMRFVALELVKEEVVLGRLVEDREKFHEFFDLQLLDALDSLDRIGGALALALVAVHQAVGAQEDVIEAVVKHLVVGGDADRTGDGHVRVGRKMQRRDLGGTALHGRNVLCGIVPAQDEGKFITADAEDALWVKGRLQVVGHSAEQLVSRRVAKEVVGDLQAVHVEDRHGKGGVSVVDMAVHQALGIAEGGLVEDARQSVVVGLVIEVAELVLDPLAGAVQNARQLADLVGRGGDQLGLQVPLQHITRRKVQRFNGLREALGKQNGRQKRERNNARNDRQAGKDQPGLPFVDLALRCGDAKLLSVSQHGIGQVAGIPLVAVGVEGNVALLRALIFLNDVEFGAGGQCVRHGIDLGVVEDRVVRI